MGKRLIVALIGDAVSNNFPFNQTDRAEALNLLGIANTILLLPGNELEEAIKKLKPSILVLGTEY